jgi:hypothetical protein
MLIWEGPNPSSVSELMDDESKNPNVSLSPIYSLLYEFEMKIVGLKMAENTRN